jgi:hypothetical protein
MSPRRHLKFQECLVYDYDYCGAGIAVGNDGEKFFVVHEYGGKINSEELLAFRVRRKFRRERVVYYFNDKADVAFCGIHV